MNGNAEAMRAEAAEIVARRPDLRPAPNWRKAAAEFQLSAVMWNALADSSLTASRPELGHMSADFGQQISALYRRMAQVATTYAETAREFDRAEACAADVPA